MIIPANVPYGLSVSFPATGLFVGLTIWDVTSGAPGVYAFAAVTWPGFQIGSAVQYYVQLCSHGLLRAVGGTCER